MTLLFIGSCSECSDAVVTEEGQIEPRWKSACRQFDLWNGSFAVLISLPNQSTPGHDFFRHERIRIRFHPLVSGWPGLTLSMLMQSRTKQT